MADMSFGSQKHRRVLPLNYNQSRIKLLLILGKRFLYLCRPPSTKYPCLGILDSFDWQTFADLVYLHTAYAYFRSLLLIAALRLCAIAVKSEEQARSWLSSAVHLHACQRSKLTIINKQVKFIPKGSDAAIFSSSSTFYEITNQGCHRYNTSTILLFIF